MPRAGSRSTHALRLLGAAEEVAGREQVDAGDLQLRRRQRAAVAADAVLGQMRRADARLLPQRRDQADRCCRGAARIRPRHRSRDRRSAACRRRGCRDRSAGRQSRARSMFGRMPAAMTTRSAVELAAVLEAHAGDAVVADESRRSAPACWNCDAARSPAMRCSSAAAARSSCRSISVSQMCTTVTSMPCLQQAVGRLQPEQAAADHHGLRVRARGREHRVDVLRDRGT